MREKYVFLELICTIKFKGEVIINAQLILSKQQMLKDHINITTELLHDKTNDLGFATIEDLHPCQHKKAKFLGFPFNTQKRL